MGAGATTPVPNGLAGSKEQLSEGERQRSLLSIRRMTEALGRSEVSVQGASWVGRSAALERDAGRDVEALTHGRGARYSLRTVEGG